MERKLCTVRPFPELQGWDRDGSGGESQCEKTSFPSADRYHHPFFLCTFLDPIKHSYVFYFLHRFIGYFECTYYSFFGVSCHILFGIFLFPDWFLGRQLLTDFRTILFQFQLQIFSRDSWGSSSRKWTEEWMCMLIWRYWIIFWTPLVAVVQTLQILFGHSVHTVCLDCESKLCTLRLPFW